MRRALVAALLLLLVGARDARAEGERILLVVDPGSAGAARRLGAELTSAGFVVVTRTSPEAADRSALLNDARALDAVATVRVHATGEGAELWIVDRVTGKTVLRDVAPDQAIDDATLATKTTELLRASLLEVRTAGFHPAEVPVPPAAEALVGPEEPPPAPAPVEPRGFVSVGGTAGWGGDLGALGFVSAEVRARLSGIFAAGVNMAIPVSGGTIEGPEGSASQLVSHATVHLDAIPFGAAHRWAPYVGVAAGALWVHTSGTAIPPYVSESADLFAALFGVRAGLSLRLTPLLALRGQLAALASVPRPAVNFAGRRTGVLAEPLVEGTLGLELAAW